MRLPSGWAATRRECVTGMLAETRTSARSVRATFVIRLHRILGERAARDEEAVGSRLADQRPDTAYVAEDGHSVDVRKSSVGRDEAEEVVPDGLAADHFRDVLRPAT